LSKIVFWNINGHPIGDIVAELAHEYDVDILALAESSLDEKKMLEPIGYHRIDELSERVKMYSRYPLEYFEPIWDDVNISIRQLNLPASDSILLVAAHLPSKLFYEQRDQSDYCKIVSARIHEQQEKVGHSRTIIFGDLNMNPFESGLISATGFHAIMDKRIVSKGSRRIKGIDYHYFYNPMWNKFGDNRTEPPGTYYYHTNIYNSYFWNMFDQVLLSYEIIDKFNNDNLTIISSVGEHSLLTNDGRPNDKFASDHLPIFFELFI